MNTCKLAYDLALIYTKTQYDEALRQKTIPIALHHPQILEDSSFLAETFTEMYIGLLNSPGLFSDIEEWEPRLLGNEE
ncbi:hypothetical protein AALG83_02060 [Christensenellaceae bacterium 44-20]